MILSRHFSLPGGRLEMAARIVLASDMDISASISDQFDQPAMGFSLENDRRISIYLLAGKNSNKNGFSIFSRSTQKHRFPGWRDRKVVKMLPESRSEKKYYNSRRFVESFSRKAIIISRI
jgi:hypothetical protein